VADPADSVNTFRQKLTWTNCSFFKHISLLFLPDLTAEIAKFSKFSVSATVELPGLFAEIVLALNFMRPVMLSLRGRDRFTLWKAITWTAPPQKKNETKRRHRFCLAFKYRRCRPRFCCTAVFFRLQ